MTIFRRNENIIGTRANIGKQPGAMTIIGDDPKKYAAAMVEYNKDKVSVWHSGGVLWYRGVCVCCDVCRDV